ncbi:MAG: metallophosphoesterase family protein [Chitinispirillaceae bacterium]|nr:metallophosphoesterase family protein [Chitinispirillaceae bacterium]
MKIGIVSDTHRNMDLLNQVVEWMSRRERISVLYHLGDDYNDVAELGDQFSELLQVPGLYDERYRTGEAPAKLFETVYGISLLLVHSLEKDTDYDDISRSDIILHGHTHRHELRLDDGKLFFNPGHLKGSLDKNMEPTFGVLTIEDRVVEAAIYDLKFDTVQSMELIRSESGLYRAG